MSASDFTLEHLQRDLIVFARERDRERFHTPKNLLLALVESFRPCGFILDVGGVPFAADLENFRGGHGQGPSELGCNLKQKE